MAHAADRVSDCGDGRVEVKLASVVGRGLVAGEIQVEVADGLEGHLLDGAGHHLLADEVVGLFVLALEDEPARFRECRESLRVRRVVGAARVERVLVELQALARGSAEDHRGETAVAEGKRLDPHGGGLVVPELPPGGVRGFGGGRRERPRLRRPRLEEGERRGGPREQALEKEFPAAGAVLHKRPCRAEGQYLPRWREGARYDMGLKRVAQTRPLPREVLAGFVTFIILTRL